MAHTPKNQCYWAGIAPSSSLMISPNMHVTRALHALLIGCVGFGHACVATSHTWQQCAVHCTRVQALGGFVGRLLLLSMYSAYFMPQLSISFNGMKSYNHKLYLPAVVPPKAAFHLSQ